jgi:hypothetical protein
MKRWLILLCVCAMPVQAQTAMKWGWEVWTCGTATFTARLGDGRNVWLRSIAGTMSASPRPDGIATSGDRILRQSLTAIYSPYLPSTLSSDQGGPIETNHGLDQHLYAVNMKQVGLAPVNLAIAQTFDPPVLIPFGIVQTTVVTATYSGPQTADQCLDSEGQLTFTFGVSQ